MFVLKGMGINDDLNGVERAVTFPIKDLGDAKAEVVHSLAKWKRLTLAEYNIKPGYGIYTDMNAIRADESLGNLHSLYVDQWDWERTITTEDRNTDFLKRIVRKIYSAMLRTEYLINETYPQLEPFLAREVFFIHSEELRRLYPDKTPKEREDAICREHGLSVIEKPSRRSESFAEWKLHQNGQCTLKDILQMDMEEAISQAIDVDNFYDLMEAKGYTVSLRSKYPSFFPKGAKRPLRLKRDGRSLTESDIEDLLDASMSDPESVIIHRAEVRPKIPYGKQHGFKALYISWMYVLGILGQGKKVTYRVPYAELWKFEQYKKQQAYIDTHGINTVDQLTERVAALKTREAELTGRRDALRKEKRKGNVPKDDVSRLTKELRGIRSELDLCRKIGADVPRIQSMLREDAYERDRGERYYER